MVTVFSVLNSEGGSITNHTIMVAWYCSEPQVVLFSDNHYHTHTHTLHSHEYDKVKLRNVIFIWVWGAVCVCVCVCVCDNDCH